jgi:hypothetical protein
MYSQDWLPANIYPDVVAPRVENATAITTKKV